MSRLGFCFALVLAACGGDDVQPGTPTWKLVDNSETASLLAVWGSDANDVWAVGGRKTIDAGPTVLHFKNNSWTRVDTGMTGFDLWWVFGLTADDIYFGGSGGTILHYHGGTFDKMTTPGTGIVFGIWGTDDSDLWAVGGPAGFVWHYDGTAWTSPTLPTGVGQHVFKVNGQSASDVWMSCDDGTALHWQGTELDRGPTGVAAPLFSIVTMPDAVIAVGGTNGQGQIAEYAAGAWSTAAIDSPAQWRGAAAHDDVAYAVGNYGTVAKREQGAWKVVTQSLVTDNNFHAAWVDPEGGLWGVGGQFDSTPLTSEGFLTYFGSTSIPEVSQ